MPVTRRSVRRKIVCQPRQGQRIRRRIAGRRNRQPLQRLKPSRTPRRSARRSQDTSTVLSSSLERPVKHQGPGQPCAANKEDRDSEAVGSVVSEQWTIDDRHRQAARRLPDLPAGRPDGSAGETPLTPSPGPGSTSTTAGCACSHRSKRRSFGLISSEVGGRRHRRGRRWRLASGRRKVVK